MDVCREHGQPPSWWATLCHEDRVLLLAEYRGRSGSKKPASRARKVGR